jgi:DNA-binding CsgD family transcriptional regulator
VATLIDRLLSKLGLRRVERRKFTLDAALVQYVQALAEDEKRPPEELAADLLNSGLAQRDLSQESWQRWLTLSRREQEVAALICLNYTTRQIAGRLMISPDTVKSHSRNLLYKFDLHSRGELRMLLVDWDFRAWER